MSRCRRGERGSVPGCTSNLVHTCGDGATRNRGLVALRLALAVAEVASASRHRPPSARRTPGAGPDLERVLRDALPGPGGGQRAFGHGARPGRPRLAYEPGGPAADTGAAGFGGASSGNGLANVADAFRSLWSTASASA